MSTKAIRDALEELRDRLNAEGIPAVEQVAIHDALAEVVEIEKAAKVFEEEAIGRGWITPQIRQAFATLSAIAKEAE